MGINLISLLLLFLSVLKANSEEIKADHEWDLIIFTQQWPETVCQEWIHHNASHTCTMPKKVDTWAVHGLWPTKLGTRGPEFCNRTWIFDPELIRPIETELMNSWTNIENGTPLYSFWAHEWNKHGTCAAVLDSLNSEMKYFSHGLKFLEQYGMNDILAKSGIVPDDTRKYKIIDIHNAVKTNLGVNPSIQCRKENGRSYLIEIRICFDKQLNLENCDGISRIKLVDNLSLITNCDTYNGVLYPHTKQPPKKVYVELYKLVTWLQWFTL